MMLIQVFFIFVLSICAVQGAVVCGTYPAKYYNNTELSVASGSSKCFVYHVASPPVANTTYAYYYSISVTTSLTYTVDWGSVQNTQLDSDRDCSQFSSGGSKSCSGACTDLNAARLVTSSREPAIRFTCTDSSDCNFAGASVLELCWGDATNPTTTTTTTTQATTQATTMTTTTQATTTMTTPVAATTTTPNQTTTPSAGSRLQTLMFVRSSVMNIGVALLLLGLLAVL